jgi:hypothetical protein
MRRITQQKLVEVDEHGVRLPDSSGDCYPACIASVFEIPLDQAPGMHGNTQHVHDWLALNFPGIGIVSRSWTEPKAPYYRAGFWIATVISSRFREPDCHHCTTDRRRKSKPEWGFYRRDECPICDGTGHARGLHAIVMEHARRIWDPHPHADWDSEPRIVGEDFFVVTDPTRLVARALPTPLVKP